MNSVTSTSYDRRMPVAERTEEPLVIRFERMRRAKIRYGRARLTVVRFGGVSCGDLGEAIRDFERGSIDAEELCWEFVRDRVVAHTPSFDWEEAELSLLLDRVVGVSTGPEFDSSSAEDVAQVLVDVAEEEREAAERMRETATKWAGGLAGQLDSIFLPAATAEKLNASIAGLLPSYRFDRLAGKPPPIPGIGEIKMPTVDWHLASKGMPELGSLSLGGGLDSWAAGGTSRITRDLGAAFFKNHLPDLAADLDVRGIGSHLAEVRWPALGLHDVLGPTMDVSAARIAGDLSASLLGNPPDFAASFGARGIAKQLVEQHWPALGLQAGLRVALHEVDWAGLLERHDPHNWGDIYGSEMRALASFMLETGINLAWAPRPEIIRELLASRTEVERNEILVRNSERILEDVEAALELVTERKFRDSVDACREIIGTCRSGHPKAAQSFAGTALSDLVHRYLGQENFRKIRRSFEAIDPMQESARRFGFYLVGRLWARAFGSFSNREDTGYNRAESAHVLGEHFHEAHLLQALLLLAGLLCEFQMIEDEREGDGHEFVIALLEPA